VSTRTLPEHVGPSPLLGKSCRDPPLVRRLGLVKLHNRPGLLLPVHDRVVAGAEKDEVLVAVEIPDMVPAAPGTARAASDDMALLTDHRNTISIVLGTLRQRFAANRAPISRASP
jgi:hypothetical protein